MSIPVHAPSRARPLDFTACGMRLADGLAVYNELQATCRACRKAIRGDRWRDEPILRNPPCGSCAFIDPSAFRDDPKLAATLKTCAQNGEPFYCHERGDMRTDAEGKHRPPLKADGTVDTSRMEICVGFLRLLNRKYVAKASRQPTQKEPKP